MKELNDWEMSSCADGWLHRYKIVEQTNDGVVEMCKLCTQTMFFPSNCDNLTYLAYHMREGLPQDHPLFEHEHPGGIKYKPKKT